MNINYPTIDTKITILARVTEARVLQFKSQYSRPEEPPQSFQPKVNKHGAIEYEVPFEYAERLLNGEPDKYFLLAPKMIYMKVLQPNGGKIQQEIRAVEPKMKTAGKGQDKQEVCVTDGNGIPVYIEAPVVGIGV